MNMMIYDAETMLRLVEWFLCVVNGEGWLSCFTLKWSTYCALTLSCFLFLKSRCGPWWGGLISRRDTSRSWVSVWWGETLRLGVLERLMLSQGFLLLLVLKDWSTLMTMSISSDSRLSVVITDLGYGDFPSTYTLIQQLPALFFLKNIKKAFHSCKNPLSAILSMFYVQTCM